MACGLGGQAASPSREAPLHFRASVHGQPWDGGLPGLEVQLPEDDPGTALLAGRDPYLGVLIVMALEGADGPGRYAIEPMSHIDDRGCGAAMGTGRQGERCAGLYLADGEVEITGIDAAHVAGRFRWSAALDHDCDNEAHDDSDFVVEEGSFRFRWTEGGMPASFAAAGGL